MDCSCCNVCESEFILTNVNRLLKRFFLTYHREDRCMEYFISRVASSEPVSYSLMIVFDKPANNIHIAKFHPELYREKDSKYLSAACFYLIIQHFGHEYLLDDKSEITLDTRSDIFENFYHRLNDFNFHIRKRGVGRTVELVSDFHQSSFDTSMIHERVFSEDELFCYA